MYLLKLKSGVFNEFQNFQAIVERESICHITTLESNNGGDFFSKDSR